jgi:1-acyl-sn-glycerol-3-phosphate acyltransferase
MLKSLAGFLLRRLGWTVEGEVPPVPRCVVVAAPHTSNWDLLYLLLMAWSKGLKISWLAKHSLFWPPLGWVLRALGGVPVIRHRPEQRVSATAAIFGALDRLYLVIPPEGTRSRTAYWKSGFYWIAREAEVPVQLTALTTPRKQAPLGRCWMPRRRPRPLWIRCGPSMRGGKAATPMISVPFVFRTKGMVPNPLPLGSVFS